MLVTRLMTRPNGMKLGFSEDQVHNHIFARGIEALVVDSQELVDALSQGNAPIRMDENDFDESEFELWRIIKQRVLERINRIHGSVRYGTFVGSKVKLPTDNTRAMELDLLGMHEDGLFVLELKVDKSSERNAFSELLAYSNYIAQMFAMSGPQDITNVLVAPMDAKITRHAFLYDLVISNRNVIAYKPILTDGTLESLNLQAYVPSDEDFKYFANRLLSHDAMGCVFASFDDLDQWYDSREVDSGVNDYTKTHLDALSSYAAQLMEAEQLHGFVFIRKPWAEIPRFYRNSLVLCAINPFFVADPERAEALISQLNETDVDIFLETPRFAFDGRLLRLAKKAISGSLAHGQDCELQTPLWAAIVQSPIEVVHTHNFGFRPTGIFREAYVSYLEQLYERVAAGDDEDVSKIKAIEVNNWLRAWMFMEMCGFQRGDDGNTPDDEEFESDHIDPGDIAAPDSIPPSTAPRA
ncbi:MAG: hypothetical protein AMXMBFR59_21560 [Rhodanobacteraceae bacterium]